MAADILGSTSSANSPYSQFFDSRARYSIATNPDTFQKTCIYTKPALHPSFIPSYLNTFQLCSLTCPEGTQFTHPSRTQGKPSVYHLRATRTPSHLHTLIPSYLNTFPLCSLNCPEGTQFTHPSRTQGKPSVYHLRATRTPPHLHTLTPFNFRTLRSQVSSLKSQVSGLFPQVSGLFPQVSGLRPQLFHSSFTLYVRLASVPP